MRIGSIIIALRQANTIFADNVFGAAHLNAALEGTFTGSSDCAFVIPTGDVSTANTHDNGLVQMITEKFSVIVANKNDSSRTDYQGVAAYNLQHDIRAQLFSALLGRYIDSDPDHDQDGIQYKSSNIVGMNGAYLWWQYDFTYDVQVRQYGNGLDGYNPDPDNMLPTFDKIYADYIQTPSFKFETLEYANLPLTASQTDEAQMVDLTKDPKGGFFWFGFSSDFDRIRR